MPSPSASLNDRDPSLHRSFGAPEPGLAAAALADLREELSSIQDIVLTLDLIGTLIDPLTQPGSCTANIDRAQVSAMVRTLNAVLNGRVTSAQRIASAGA